MCEIIIIRFTPLFEEVFNQESVDAWVFKQLFLLLLRMCSVTAVRPLIRFYYTIASYEF